MKKRNCWLIFVLCAVLFASCGKAGQKENAEPSSENTEATEPSETTPEGNFVEPVAFKEGHYYMEDLDAAMKRVGRTQYDNHMLTCDWSGTGVEFKVWTEGETMTVGYKTSYDTYFTVYVDGVEVSRELLSGNARFRIKLTAGDHDISITKENEINISQNSYCYLEEIGFQGKFYEKPADRELFFEVIGDSITCGDGSLGAFREGKLWGKNEHSAYASFAAVAARSFKADYNLVSRGGIGIIRSRDEVGLPMPAIYEYISPYRDMQHKWDFSRKPDLIIFELGANDSTEVCTEEEYYEAMCTFLDRVLELNGRDVPVVWTGKSETHYESAKKYEAEHPEVRFYAFRFSYGTSGGGGSSNSVSGHPNVEEQRQYGEKLAEFIREMHILGDL